MADRMIDGEYLRIKAEWEAAHKGVGKCKFCGDERTDLDDYGHCGVCNRATDRNND